MGAALQLELTVELLRRQRELSGVSDSNLSTLVIESQLLSCVMCLIQCFYESHLPAVGFHHVIGISATM